MNLTAWKFWRDTTHDTVSAMFAFENESEHTRYIYKGIQGLIWSTCHGIITILKCFFCSILRLFWGKGGMPLLPDDLVFDILSRLPASDVLQCRRVCRRWMSLTSTPCFLEHLKGSPPIILLHHYDPEGGLRLYSIDLTPDVPCIKRFNTKKLHMDCFGPPLFGGTCDGLVLLFCRREFSFHLHICNPFTGREIMEVAAEGFFFCGFWFHPAKREYFFLTASIGSQGLHEYKIFNLRGESKVVGWYDAFPTEAVPININGSLYNLLGRPVTSMGCIMIFDIDSEKIEFGPHPHNKHCDHRHDFRRNPNAGMRLLEVEGSLGFVHVCSYGGRSIHLWILADNASWCWIPRYNLEFHWDPKTTIYPLSGMQGGEILIDCSHSRLFVVNLETRRIRKIDISISYPRQYIFLTASSYAISLDGVNRLASFI